MSGESAEPADRHVTPLDQWVAMHGPLSPDVALVIAIDVCAHASRMTAGGLSEAIGSLNVTRIFRGATGRWQWMPVRAQSPAPAIRDSEVIERLGALLFQCVTGRAQFDPFADERGIRTRLRSLRPDLPSGVADLTVGALAARRLGHRTLDAFARDVGQVLGIAQQPERPRRRTMAILGTLVVGSALFAALWWTGARSNDPIESHGLTTSETALVDVTEETAQGFAMMDEHTAALQEYQQIARWLRLRLAPEDPRLAWNAAHDGWVRGLRGDRLTTEQVLGFGNGATRRLEATLGDRHPYTRAARLELAVTLVARGATAEAAVLRGQADTAARALLGDASDALTGVPAPPGVVAHLAPNAPEHEGFRRSHGGEFFVPLTSIQRLFGGRDGWRLHLIARGTCRASVVVGNAPHLIVVTARQGEDKRWSVAMGGTTPAITMNGLAGDTVGLSLIADGSGAVLARLGAGESRSTVIDASAKVPDPPYSLAFSGGADGLGCNLVWFEIPFPFAPKQ
jgi:hypothetical protein